MRCQTGPMRQVTVAAAQLQSTSDPVQNLQAATQMVRRAADHGAQLVVLPEASMARFGTDLKAVAQPLNGPFADGIRAVAQETGTWVVVGMFEPAGERVSNTVLATDGSTEYAYRKRHMFDAFGQRESDHVAPGIQNVLFDALGTRIGVATCYDVRFAHQFVELGQSGAEIICLPTSWASGDGKARQWQTLSAARAMDAQAFVVAADQAYQEPLRRAANGIGESRVIDPLGEVVASLGAEPDVLVTTINLEAVARVRATIPVLAWQAEHLGSPLRVDLSPRI